MSACTGQEETVAGLTLTVAPAELTPEAGERWARRAEFITRWLVGEWRREQEQLQEGAVRRCDLN